MIALVSGLAGWALLAALERVTRRARPVWTGVALTVLALSLAPLTGQGMTAASRVTLALMHGAVAAVLVPGLLTRKAGRDASADAPGDIAGDTAGDAPGHTAGEAAPAGDR